MQLRADFPYEVGYWQMIRAPISEAAWAAERFERGHHVFGPKNVKTYDDYLTELTNSKMDRLLRYSLVLFEGADQNTAMIRGRTFFAYPERNNLITGENPLFREMISKVEARMGLIPNSFSPLRPSARNDGKAVAPAYALIHDTTTGSLYAADYEMALEIVYHQVGSIEETAKKVTALRLQRELGQA
jgi:hypothetical protein